MTTAAADFSGEGARRSAAGLSWDARRLNKLSGKVD
jgi:hypothetical protein